MTFKSEIFCLMLFLSLSFFGEKEIFAQENAKGFWSQATEGAKTPVTPHTPTASGVTGIPPQFSLAIRQVTVTIFNQPHILTILEGLLRPPPIQEIRVQVPPANYEPIWDKLTSPEIADPWGRVPAPATSSVVPPVTETETDPATWSGPTSAPPTDTWTDTSPSTWTGTASSGL